MQAAPLSVDLHCHSTASDGVLSPVQVAQRAHANGVQLWALTDHDTLSGLPQAQETAQMLGLRFIPGVEVSVTWSGRTVHIVGLGVNPDHAPLRDGLEHVRRGRTARAQAMADKLAEHGMPGAYAGALRHAGDPALISRTHLARFLVEAGYCKHIKVVFQRYLADDGPCYVPMQWATLGEAVDWIVGAGGKAIVAHPGRYAFSDLQFDALFDTFRDLGGVGIEVVTGSHSPAQYREYAAVAKRYGFQASCGSDFHGTGESRLDLGRLPPLPAGLTPVWRDWL